jgi:hypothetical protein
MNAFSESKRLRLEANSAIADFVAVEIEAGLTLCRIAKIELRPFLTASSFICP